MTSHTDEATFDIPHQIITRWNLEKIIHTITAENTAHDVKRVRSLKMELSGTNHLGNHKPHGHFHVQFITHGLNLAVMEFMRAVHENVCNVKNF